MAVASKPSNLGNPASKGQGLLIFKMTNQAFFAIVLQFLFLLFSVYRFMGYVYNRVQIRWLTITYHQNRTPELIQQDVSSFKKIPRGIGAVLSLKGSSEEGGGVDGLLEQASDLSAWCIGSSIEFLILYERSGVLKSIPQEEIERRIGRKLGQYYGAENVPTFKINFPYTSASYSQNSTLVSSKKSSSKPEKSSVNGSANASPAAPVKPDLEITILSLEDGRQSIVDLTRSLAELAVEKKISPRDITVKTLDNEIKTLVSDEPDLLYVFGPTLDLDGFPPWQIRLSEIFYMRDNDEVSYAVFLKGLEKYSGVKINVGR